MKLNKAYFIFLGVVVFFLSSCSNSKKSTLGQFYHNLNARYNTYFNANEKYNVAKQTLKKSIKEDYKKVLCVYEDETPEGFKAGLADFSTIDERAGKNLDKHPTSKWVDNGLLIDGAAHYLSGNYAKAISVFEYITSEYKKGIKREHLRVYNNGKSSKLDKKIKEADKTKKPIDIDFMEHPIARNEALIWMAKSYTRLEKFKEAQAIITYAKADLTFPKEYKIDLQTVQVFVDLQRKDYNHAITSLDSLIAYTKNKKKLARYYFIEGQVFEELENYTAARNSYASCLKKNPTYGIEFNSKLKIAHLSRGKNGSDEAIAIIKKLLRDDKNEEFFDQLYFELAEIAFSNGNKQEAIDNYTKATKVSKSNTEVKGRAFERIAQIYYTEENYISSKKYYDSTALYLKTNEVSRYVSLLTRLTEKLDIVTVEDSLQRLAKLPKEDARRIIKQQIREAERKAEAEKEAAERQKGVAVSTVAAAGNSSGSWYFGNPSIVQNGLVEFKKVWGERTLQDYWRLASRQNNFLKTEENNTTGDSTKTNTTTNQKTLNVDDVLKLLPYTEEEKKKSTEKLAEAAYSAGLIYKDEIENNKKAKELFNLLDKKYNPNKFTVESLYNLYLIAIQEKNQADINLYKNKILADYPNSKLAKAIIDPNSLNKEAEEKNKEDVFYTETYSLLQENKFDNVLVNVASYSEKFPKKNYANKFELLKCLAIGGQRRYDDYVAALNILSTKDTSTESKMAKDLLARFLNSELPRLKESDLKPAIDTTISTSKKTIISTIKKEDKSTTDSLLLKKLVVVENKDSASKIKVIKDTVSIKKDTIAAKKAVYVFDSKKQHIFWIELKDKNLKAEDIIQKIQAFNSSNFAALKLKVEIENISSSKIISVKTLSDAGKAKMYSVYLGQEKGIIQQLQIGTQYESYISSVENYATLIDTKDIAGYKTFYSEKYK